MSWVSRSATERPASTAARDIDSDLKRSISPVLMSVTSPTAVPGAVPAMPIPNMPPIRYSW